MPVVYTFYEQDPEQWKYKHHGTLEEIYDQNTFIRCQSSIETVAKAIEGQGKYIMIDDLSGFTHIIEKEIYKDKIL